MGTAYWKTDRKENLDSIYLDGYIAQFNYRLNIFEIADKFFINLDYSPRKYTEKHRRIKNNSLNENEHQHGNF